MIKQVIILRDFVRGELGIDNSIYNSVNSLKDLFSYQINQATKLPVVSIFDCIDANKFIEQNNINNNFSNLQKWSFSFNNISAEAEKYLINSLQDSFVLGYHTPNILIETLIKNNIPFLDIFETAYRYMQDSFIGIRSNVKSVNDFTKENQLSIHTMYVFANYIKAYYNRRSTLNITENSCLLIGQTLSDSVLINGNSFASLFDYKDEIIKISKEYDTIYYKQHPFERLSKEVLKFLKTIPNSQEIYSNTYQILSNPNIKLVAGLNSGVLYEAKFFGKKSKFFFNKVYNYTQESIESAPNVFTILNSNSHIFKINFWAEVLKDIVETSFVDTKEDVFFENYQELIANYLNIVSAFELKIYNKKKSGSVLKKLKEKIHRAIYKY